MADLERHLQADGIDTQAVVRNSGAPVDMDMAFQVARQEAGALVLGQEEFLDSLLIAYKRPFVAGSQEGAPLCRAQGGTAPCGASPRRWGGRGC